jgi:hypothetical protein
MARALVAIVVAVLWLTPQAGAAPAAGIVGNASLATFDTQSPATMTIRPITGLQHPDEKFIGLDTRPATGELYGVTVPEKHFTDAVIETYTIDPATAAATWVGEIVAQSPETGDVRTGMDFQPLRDQIRVVNESYANIRIFPATGKLAALDSLLSFTAPATGPVTAIAYDRNVAPGPPGTPPPAGAKTTVYGIDNGSQRLVVIGGIDGTGPNGGANGGKVTAIGQLQVAVFSTGDSGFDIAPDGAAYATLQSNADGDALYTVNLATGAATKVGPTPARLREMTVITPDNCPFTPGYDPADLDGDGQGDACDDDIDGDGVSNAAEQARGTDPRNPDSDSDGVRDGADTCPVEKGLGADGCDRRAPTIRFRKVPRKLTFKRFFHGVVSRIAVGERARLDVVLLASLSSASAAKAGDLVLAEKHLKPSRKTRSVRLKPKRSLFGRTFLPITVRLRVTATDAAGNRRTATRKIKIAG